MTTRWLAMPGVAAVLVLLAGCSDPVDPVVPPGPPPPSPPALYVDVTSTHLPTASLGGLIMDARSADLDADGDLDLVLAHEFAANILLLNDGAGRFTDASARLPRAVHDSEDVGIADFDGDGDPDIVIVSEDDRTNELYLNDGSATFADASSRLPVTGISNAVVVEDIDGDGAPDIFIGNNGQNRLLLNDGSGGFADATAARLPVRFDITQDLELGDVDGDGDLDLLVGNEDRNRLLINDGTGVFADESDARIPSRAGPEETREADFGDADGDGDLDILFANVRSSIPGASEQNRLLINDGTGVFADETANRLPVVLDRSFDGDFLDVDGDGDQDILTTDLGVGGAARPYLVFLNDGTGHFELERTSILPPGTTGLGFDIEFVDVDGDGLEDLYLASRGSGDRLLLRRP